MLFLARTINKTSRNSYSSSAWDAEGTPGGAREGQGPQWQLKSSENFCAFNLEAENFAHTYRTDSLRLC